MNKHPFAVAGVILGIVLGFAGAFGGFSAFLIVLVLGAVGGAAGLYLDGDLHLEDVRGRGDRTER